MTKSIRHSFAKRSSLLGAFALATLLTGCLDQGEPTDTEDEATQDLSASFAHSCDTGSFTTAVDTSTMRLFINHATATGCKRLNGTKINPPAFNGRCFNDLSNRDGFLTCAGG